MFAEGGASAIWGSYIRYIGAGALAAGGIISLAKSLPLIIRTFSDAMTVSYTHLDVYKRQLLSCMVVFRSCVYVQLFDHGSS